MAAPPVPDDTILETLAAYEANGRNQVRTAAAIGKSRSYVQEHLRHAARRGLMLNHPEAMPGFEITKVTTDPNGGQHITQKQEHGTAFEMPKTHFLGKMTVQRDAEGRVVQDWIRAVPDDLAREAAMQAVVHAFKEDLPRAAPVAMSIGANADLLNQYTVTDLHFGMLSWGEETGADYDLKIAEKLLLDWFAAAIRMSPDAGTAVLAQLGDLLHHDSKASVTPAHGHVLDADSRLQKMIRVAIRAMRQVIQLLLEKHERVHVIMADANHDEAGGAWLREMFAVVYENEPRVTVDTSPNTYYAFEHGLTSLFYHHGHKRKAKDVDSVFAGKFRQIYGRTKFAYGHTGHLHSDELISTNLMKVERHETLAAPDAYAANGGWLSGRSAKVITYHKRFGEVGRITLTPEMVQA
jgi:hypothetical protein